MNNIIINEWDKNGAGCGSIWGLKIPYPFSEKPFSINDIINLYRGDIHVGDFRVKLLSDYIYDSTSKIIYVVRI